MEIKCNIYLNKLIRKKIFGGNLDQTWDSYQIYECLPVFYLKIQKIELYC